MLSSGMIASSFFIFPGNFTHSAISEAHIIIITIHNTTRSSSVFYFTFLADGISFLRPDHSHFLWSKVAKKYNLQGKCFTFGIIETALYSYVCDVEILPGMEITETYYYLSSFSEITIPKKEVCQSLKSQIDGSQLCLLCLDLFRQNCQRIWTTFPHVTDLARNTSCFILTISRHDSSKRWKLVTMKRG